MGSYNLLLTKEKGIILQPKMGKDLQAYVDADFTLLLASSHAIAGR